MPGLEETGSNLEPVNISQIGGSPVTSPLPVTISGGGGGPVSVADGADVTQGAIADAAVTSDANGTISAKLRGLVKIFADIWDSVNHRFNVAVGNFPAGFNVNNSPTVNQGTAGAAAWKVDGSAVTQPVSAASLPLPTGASTEATLALIKAKTDNLDVLLSTRTKPADTQKVDGSAVTQPISAVTLPLPAGAATDASLTTIDTDLKATQPRDVTDRVARLLGHVTVDTAPTTAITAASLPLPGNAAQETGGNLALLAMLIQKQFYATTKLQAQALTLQAAQAGQYVPVPEVPEFLGGF